MWWSHPLAVGRCMASRSHLCRPAILPQPAIGTDISQYRAAIGRWHCFCSTRPLQKHLEELYSIFVRAHFVHFLNTTSPLSDILKPSLVLALYLQTLLIISCDVELNPGPQTLMISHSNVHSLSPHDRSLKIDEIDTILCKQRKCDFICLSETWLDSTFTDDQVTISGFQVQRRDRTLGDGNRRAGGVAIYNRDDLPVRRRKDLEHDDLEFVLTELVTSNKRVLFGCCYRAPNATAEEKDTFLDSFQQVLPGQPRESCHCG